MRILILFMLSLSFAAFADEDFDQRSEALNKELETKLMHARAETKFKSYPNHKYIERYNKLVEAHITKELALHQEFCKKEGDKTCLTDKQVEEIKAQYRIVTAVENRKNDWASKGLSEVEIRKKTSELTACHEKNQDCDKVEKADRDIASVKTKNEEKKEEEIETKETDPRHITTVDLTKREVKVVVSEKTKKLETKKEETKKDDSNEDDKKDEEIKESAEEKSEEERTTKVKEKLKEEKASGGAEVLEASDDEKTPRNYKPESCRWVKDLPRKVVNGPGCGPKNRSKICTGYVICEQKEGGAKFIRMSTCAADKCGSSDEDAVRCTKDMGHYSMKPQGESKLFMSPELKKILSGGATRQ